jgi:hypothetical protein
MFKVYCKHPKFGAAPLRSFETMEGALKYTDFMRKISPEITVVDEMDLTVVEVKNHKYVFPEELVVQNK